MNSNKRAELLKIFGRIYKNPKTALNYSNEYQLLISVILSAQCTDKKVNEITPELFQQFPDFLPLSGALVPAVEKIIRPVNYYRTKAKHLIETAKIVCLKFAGNLPRTQSALRELPGVGQKTANVVLGELGIEKTFPVDTHVFRVSKRLALAKGKNAKEVEEELKKLFEAKDWRNLHHYLILHGRQVCKAQRPLCNECALAKLCPSRQLYINE